MSWKYSQQYQAAYKEIRTLYAVNNVEKGEEFIRETLIPMVKSSLERRWLLEKLEVESLHIHVERNLNYNPFPDYRKSKELLDAEKQKNEKK